MSRTPRQNSWRRQRRRDYVLSRTPISTLRREGVLMVGQVYSFVYAMNEYRMCLMHVHELVKPGSPRP